MTSQLITLVIICSILAALWIGGLIWLIRSQPPVPKDNLPRVPKKYSKEVERLLSMDETEKFYHE